MEDVTGVTGGSSPDAGAIIAGASPTPTQDTGTSSADVNLQQPVQGEQSTQTPAQEDPLAGFPSDDELKAAVANRSPFAEQAARIKSAYDALKPQLNEFQTKYQAVEPFQQHLERFEKPEQLQEIVDFREKLYGWENDPKTGQLIPSTQSLVQQLTETAPERADFLSADLLNGMTRDPETGRQMTRLDLALEAIASDPARKAKALSILGGVEPTSIAPTWQPTAEELNALCDDPENPTPQEQKLQDEYCKLPYDKRDKLRLNDPEIIKDYLEDQRFKRETRERDAQSQDTARRQAQQREQYIQREAENAGNQLVEQQFKEGFSGFAQNLCEKFQPIKPLDPQSPEAQGMDAAQIAATNEKIQKTNQGAGLFASTVVAALAHPETRFLAEEFAKAVGISPEMLQKFDAARLEFAANNRNFGTLKFRATLGQNGNGGVPQDIGMLESNAQRARRALIANGNAIAQPIMSLLSDLFSLQAQSHNSTLNGATQARPAITGNSYDPTQVAQRPPATSEAEIRQRMREGAQAIAAR